MEAWRQWLLGEKNNDVPRRENRIDLTPTGLLMEGDHSNHPNATYTMA